MSSTILLSLASVATFMLLALPGYIARKTNIIQPEHMDGISMLLVNFLWPAMLVDVMSSVPITKERLHTVLFVGAVTLVFYGLIAAVSFGYWKLRGSSGPARGILAGAVTLCASGFIGLPFIRASLGNEAAFIASIVQMFNDLYIFTFGIAVCQYGKDEREKFKLKSLLTPGFCGILVGLLVFFFSIPIPEFIGRALNLLGGSTTAIALFLIGAQLAEIEFREIITRKYVVESSLIKLFVVPLILFLFLYFTGIGTPLANRVLVVMLSVATANSLAVFARRYKSDISLATSCVMTSTAFLVVSLPIWMTVTALAF